MERVKYQAAGSGNELLQPFLDSQVRYPKLLTRFIISI